MRNTISINKKWAVSQGLYHRHRSILKLWIQLLGSNLRRNTSLKKFIVLFGRATRIVVYWSSYFLYHFFFVCITVLTFNLCPSEADKGHVMYLRRLAGIAEYGGFCSIAFMEIGVEASVFVFCFHLPCQLRFTFAFASAFFLQHCVYV